MNELEWLLDTLWAKQAEPTKYSFTIPHTVVYRNQNPKKWFFASQLPDGTFTILKKNEANLTSAHISDKILKPPAKAKPTEFPVAQSYCYHAALYVKFLTQTSDFCGHQILQKFVWPRKNINHLIECKYSRLPSG